MSISVDILPAVRAPTARRPFATAFAYGGFFGFIVLPCNPGFIGAFFSKQLALSIGEFGLNMLHFLVFALGIGAPLLALTRHRIVTNRAGGGVMLAIASYYLVAVFNIPQNAWRAIVAA